MLSALIFHCITINLLNILSKGTFLLPEPYLLLFLSQLRHSVHLPFDTLHLPQDRYHLYNEVCVNYVLPQISLLFLCSIPEIPILNYNFTFIFICNSPLLRHSAFSGQIINLDSRLHIKAIHAKLYTFSFIFHRICFHQNS